MCNINARVSARKSLKVTKGKCANNDGHNYNNEVEVLNRFFEIE